jgi:hypothetical protein
MENSLKMQSMRLAPLADTQRTVDARLRAKRVSLEVDVHRYLAVRGHDLRFAYDLYMAGRISRGVWERRVREEIEFVKDIHNNTWDGQESYGLFTNDPEFWAYDGNGIPALRIIFAEIPPAIIDNTCRDIWRDPKTRRPCPDFDGLRGWLKQTA